MKYTFFAIICVMAFFRLKAQPNYDETKIPTFQLPPLLKTLDGTEINSPGDWEQIRRPEIIALFEDHMFGRAPQLDIDVNYQIRQLSATHLGSIANLKEVVVTLKNDKGKLDFTILLVLPKDRPSKVPLFLAMNFTGNHSIHPDSSIFIHDSWVKNKLSLGIVNNKANRYSRGKQKSRWPIEMIIKRGYGLATVYYGDIDPDFDDGFKNGVHALSKIDHSKSKTNTWGSIAAWAWGYSRVMDYLEFDEDVDANQVILLGHSRLGKTALWAGALDQRFSMVISNNSGCGGAALSRRAIGETVGVINQTFPHWFCKEFHQYGKRENELPVDQHMLLALIAPRPLYVASASEDKWADPKGEYLSLFHAGEVYKLYRDEIFTSTEQPMVDHPVRSGKMHYHLRTGQHGVTDFDWEQYLDFADTYLRSN